MRTLAKSSCFVGLIVLGLLSPACAAFVVVMQQEGSDVVAKGSGSLDTAALSFTGTGTGYETGVWPSNGYVGLGPDGDSTPFDQYLGTILGPGNFGGGGPTLPTSGSGDLVFTGGSTTGGLIVPEGYGSGDPLSDTVTFAGSTYSSLGITPGTYTWTWGSGRTADSFTLEINNVPEPASLAALGVPAAMCLLRRRRTRGLKTQLYVP